MSAYTDLITSEHAGKPKFRAVVELTTDPFVDALALLSGFDAKFDIDTAIGVQLDVVGEWVGFSRQITTPLTGVYFEWDTAGVGWDQGYWKRPFDPDTGLTNLPDDAYRIALKAQAALNQWDGRIETAIADIDPIFPNNSVWMIDNQNMTMTVVVSGAKLDPVYAALLTGGYLALKPGGVSINYLFSSAPPAPIFAFDTSASDLFGGWDVGAWGQSTPVT